MTTNETMQDLLKLIGGVKVDVHLSLQPRPGHHWEWGIVEPRGIVGGIDQFIAVASRTEREAQALIETAAIEWLNKDGRSAKIYGPNCNHVDGERATGNDEWVITVFRPFDIAYGPTLLEALHAAVKAVKESKNEH